MNGLLILGLMLSWFAMGVGCWLGWQLLRQNGRMLLRLEELEKRLDQLEFGELNGTGPKLEDGAGPEKSDSDQRLVDSASTNGENDRANRFSNRSLARSKIQRDGLKAGTPAPDFRLPCLDGNERSLRDFRGRRVLLVFSDPHCGPCQAVAPELEKFHRTTVRRNPSPQPSPRRTGRGITTEDSAWKTGSTGEGMSLDIQVVMISRGEPKENRAKVKEHGLTFPVLLQQRWEISRLYAIFATPVAYVLDEEGMIVNHVAVGVEPIQALLAEFSHQTNQAQKARAEFSAI
jgi:peroxiredoxin